MANTAYHPATLRPSVKGMFESLGLSRNLVEAHMCIISGMSPEVVTRLAGLLGLTPRTTCQLVGILPGTLAYRIRSTAHLSPEQGARVYWVVQVLDAAIQLFDGDVDGALTWMEQPARGLRGERPIDLLTTAMGAEAVTSLVNQIQHGVVI